MDSAKIPLASESQTKELGATMSRKLGPGDVVLLTGQLGAGKTTLVRGLLEALGHNDIVRSPTFNIVQSFDTQPPVVHVDLYRVNSLAGLDLEDYLSTHIVLIEWPDHAMNLFNPNNCWQLRFEINGDARIATVTPPKSEQGHTSEP